MPLKKKFLKYSPDITPEIFKKVWDVFENTGYDVSVGEDTIYKNWSHWKAIILGPVTNDICTCHLKDASHLTETTVAAIIRFNPLEKLAKEKVVSKYVLPAKWHCPYSSEEEFHAMNSFYKAGWVYIEPNGIRGVNSDDFKNPWVCTPQPGYTKITFGEFSQYVMKANPVKTKVTSHSVSWSSVSKEDLLKEANRRYPKGTMYKSITSDSTYESTGKMIAHTINHSFEIHDRVTCTVFKGGKWADVVSTPKRSKAPQYVRCIKALSPSFISGKIYKCQSGTTATRLFLIKEGAADYESYPYIGNTWGFEATTKSAYDKQQDEPVLMDKSSRVAVHCSTIEEYKVLKEHYRRTFVHSAYSPTESVVPLDNLSCTSTHQFYGGKGYEIIPFCQWAVENSIKMKSTKSIKLSADLIGSIISFQRSGKFYNNVLVTVEGSDIYLLNNSHTNNDGHSDRSTYKYSLKYSDLGWEKANYEIFDITIISNPVSAKLELSKSLVGKFVSFTRKGYFYDKVLVTVEGNSIYLLNNCHSNNNGHSDKSIYKYSLYFCSWKEANEFISDVKILDDQTADRPKPIADDFKFQIGEWYKNIHGNYARCKTIESGGFGFDERIKDFKYEVNSGSWMYHDDMVKVDFYEIKKYLQYSFKVGDYVCITKSPWNWNSARMDHNAGRIVRIDSISSSGAIGFIDNGDYSYIFNDGHFRPVTQAEKNAIKRSVTVTDIPVTVDIETCISSSLSSPSGTGGRASVILTIADLPSGIKYDGICEESHASSLILSDDDEEIGMSAIVTMKSVLLK